jgi:hypothetical protein
VAGALLAEQRAALAELPEAHQRHLVQALESLPAVLARHPDLQPAHPAISPDDHAHGQGTGSPLES